MTDGFCLANTQWQSGTQDSVTMPEPCVELTTFKRWLSLQQTPMSIELLYAIAADLAKKGYPGVMFDVRRCADDLKSLTRHHEKKV